MTISYFDKYKEYIRNSGSDKVKERHFIEDFEPIGTNVIDDMVKHKMIKRVNIKGVDYIKLV